MRVTGKSSHWKKIKALFRKRTKVPISFGNGGRRMVLKIAEIIIPDIDRVIIRLVKMGKLNDKTVKLNFSPPNNIGSQPNKNNKRAAVAHDQNPSRIV